MIREDVTDRGDEELLIAAQARAAIYDLLAGLFSYHFSVNEFVEQVAAKEAMTFAAADVLAGSGYALDVRPVIEIARATQNVAALSDIQSEYVALFDRPSESHALSPFESVQRKGMADLQMIGELREFYSRFGLAPALDAVESPDHCSVEFAFMSYLTVQATQEDDPAKAEGLRDGLRDFMGEHAMVWMPRWFDNLASATKHPYFAAAAQLAQRFLAEEAERLGVGADRV